MVLVTEPFFDDHIIDSTSNVKIDSVQPKLERKIIENDRPYEGNFNAYYTSIQEDNSYKIYYRAQKKGLSQYTSLLVSKDGLHFNKPNLALIEVNGNSNNNIISDEMPRSHNFFPCKGRDKYYALGGLDSVTYPKKGVYLYESTDSLNWREVRKVFSKKDAIKGFKSVHFDANNQIVYDPYRNEYKFFIRHNPKSAVRSVQISTSKDLSNFSKLKEIDCINFTLNDDLSMYMLNASIYPDSPYFIGMSTMEQGNNHDSKRVHLVFSRDGYSWTEVVKDYANFKIPYSAVTGVVKSKDQQKLYVYLQKWWTGDIFCYSYKLHRMRKISSKKNGILTTKKIVLASQNMFVNYKTKANGHLTMELYDDNDQLISKTNPLIGNQLNKQIRWIKHKQFKPGGRYSVKFTLNICDLYSFSYDTVLQPTEP